MLIDCMWQIMVDGEDVCIPAEPTAEGKLARCEFHAGCGYEKKLTAEDYRNAPRLVQDTEQTAG